MNVQWLVARWAFINDWWITFSRFNGRLHLWLTFSGTNCVFAEWARPCVNILVVVSLRVLRWNEPSAVGVFPTLKKDIISGFACLSRNFCFHVSLAPFLTQCSVFCQCERRLWEFIKLSYQRWHNVTSSVVPQQQHPQTFSPPESVTTSQFLFTCLSIFLISDSVQGVITLCRCVMNDCMSGNKGMPH